MKIIFLYVVCLISMAFVGCSDSDTESQELILTLDWFQNANHAGIYEAVDKGFFAEEGLNVVVEPPADPTAILSLVASGDSDFGLFYQPDLMQARNAGVPVLAIAGVVQRPLNSMMALQSSGIDRPGKLAGKKVGYTGIPWN